MSAAAGVVGVVAGTGPSLGGVGGSEEAAGASGVGGTDEAAGAGGMGGDFVVGRGDINADGCVDLRDWVIFERDFGCALVNCGDPRADLQPDGWLDVLDELILFQHWYEGESCRPRCEPTADGGGGAGAGGDSGAGGEPSTDLNEDGCVDWDDLELLAESYGCGPGCAAPGTDVVPDGCVDDDDATVVAADLSGDAACVPPP